MTTSEPLATTTEQDELAAIICRVGNLEAVGLDADIFEAGFSSINALNLLLDLEQVYNVSIPDEQYIQARTVRALHALILDLRREQTA